MFKGIIRALISPITSLAGSVIGGYNARKEVAAKSAARVEEAKIELKVAKIEGQIKQIQRDSEMDQDYDMQVLRNRDKSWADEFIIVIWFAIFLLHFIPYTQPYMASGWDAMGYSDNPPWWFEFGMLGILVSTLGLMRLFKIFIGKFKSENKNG